MTKIFCTLAISALLLASASAARAQGLSVGIRIGQPPSERAYRVPPQPGPEYVWVEGYQYPQGSRYAWHNGYWTRPPYAGAYWVAPYYVGGQYYVGQWQGPSRSFAHDHRWDRSRQRDERRNPYANDRNHDNRR
jgi:hypothetical protein